MIENMVVLLFTSLVLAGAMVAAFIRHTLYCIIGLGVALFGLAGIFLYLGSPFVAAMQVLIYIGGIAVAMVFALMMSVSLSRQVEHRKSKVLGSVAIAAVFFAVMGWLISTATFPMRDQPAPAEEWAVAELGHAFMTTYSVVFVGLSVTLLLAIVSAVLVAKTEDHES